MIVPDLLYKCDFNLEKDIKLHPEKYIIDQFNLDNILRDLESLLITGIEFSKFFYVDTDKYIKDIEFFIIPGRSSNNHPRIVIDITQDYVLDYFDDISDLLLEIYSSEVSILQNLKIVHSYDENEFKSYSEASIGLKAVKSHFSNISSFEFMINLIEHDKLMILKSKIYNDDILILISISTILSEYKCNFKIFIKNKDHKETSLFERVPVIISDTITTLDTIL